MSGLFRWQGDEEPLGLSKTVDDGGKVHWEEVVGAREAVELQEGEGDDGGSPEDAVGGSSSLPRTTRSS